MGQGRLTMALPKGRMLREVVDLFALAGVELGEILEDSRKLVFDLNDTRVLVVRSQDVITYVEHGAADIGIVGKDVLLEAAPDLYEPLDLGLGYCRLAVAGPVGATNVAPRDGAHIRIATKYPRLAEAHFRKKGMQVEIIKLYGSIELAPLTGLTDFIVDLVSTGETLRQNGMCEIETILESTSRLIVNSASMKTRSAAVIGLVENLKRVLGDRG
ncbi:MAG: ATP phosphoribosyltransferase [Deltaproteobacteria bacterium]|nr:MAG: ATP phosphoribosyltransferase [Deltaproteobacteria bacterium]